MYIYKMRLSFVKLVALFAILGGITVFVIGIVGATNSDPKNPLYYLYQYKGGETMAVIGGGTALGGLGILFLYSTPWIYRNFF